MKGHFGRLWLLGSLLWITTGCGATGNTAGSLPLNTNPAALVPADIKAVKEMTDPGVLTSLPRLNPFEVLVKSKKIEVPETNTPDPNPVVVVPPPPDPFEQVSLDGIIQRGKKSLILLSQKEGKTKILHLGDIFNIGGKDNGGPAFQIQIQGVDKNQVHFQVLNPPSNMPPEMQAKTLKLDSLVGFKSKKASTSTATTATSGSGAGATTTNPQTAPPTNTTTAATPISTATANGTPTPP